MFPKRTPTVPACLTSALGGDVPGLDEPKPRAAPGKLPTDVTFHREFHASRAELEAAGFDVDSYVAQRRIDEGLDELRPRTDVPDPATDIGTRPTTAAGNSREAQFEREFRENQAAFEEAGFTLEDYIAQRRRDEGLAALDSLQEGDGFMIEARQVAEF